MLVLSRKSQEAVVVGSPDGSAGLIRITVVGIRDGRVKLGFEAAVDVPVDRAEVWDRRHAVIPSNGVPLRTANSKREQTERWEDDGGEIESDGLRLASQGDK